MKTYCIKLAGAEEYTGPVFRHLEEAIMYAQDRGWLTWDEDELKYVYVTEFEIVEFID